MDQYLQENINSAPFTEQQKNDLAVLVNSFGPNMVNFIADVTIRDDFKYISNDVYNYARDAANAYTAYMSGDGSTVLQLITKSIGNPVYDFGRFVLPLVLDIKVLKSKSQNSISPELWEAMNKLEARVFRELPQSELLLILQTNLVFFLDKVDLVYQLKRRYVYEGGEASENWGLEYLRALQQNEEVIGANNIMVENKVLAPFVKNWLQDFASAISTPINQRTALEEAQYFSKSANSTKLSAEEKNQLQKILQLHDWLLHPYATMEEIEVLENQSWQLESKPAQRVASTEVFAAKPVISVPPQNHLTLQDIQTVPRKPVPVVLQKPQPTAIPKPLSVSKPVIATPPPSFFIPRPQNNLQDILQDRKQKGTDVGAPKTSGIVNSFSMGSKPARSALAPAVPTAPLAPKPTSPAPSQKLEITKIAPIISTPVPAGPTLPDIEDKLAQLKSRVQK